MRVYLCAVSLFVFVYIDFLFTALGLCHTITSFPYGIRTVRALLIYW